MKTADDSQPSPECLPALSRPEPEPACLENIDGDRSPSSSSSLPSAPSLPTTPSRSPSLKDPIKPFFPSAPTTKFVSPAALSAVPDRPQEWTVFNQELAAKPLEPYGPTTMLVSPPTPDGANGISPLAPLPSSETGADPYMFPTLAKNER
jgi:hypothetical protein